MMKKLRLTLDALTVESFMVEKTEGRGTVAAYVATEADQGCTGPDTDCTGLANKCYVTCGNSCGGTCRLASCGVPWQCP